jgi:hypothetical protein
MVVYMDKYNIHFARAAGWLSEGCFQRDIAAGQLFTNVNQIA